MFVKFAKQHADALILAVVIAVALVLHWLGHDGSAALCGIGCFSSSSQKTENLTQTETTTTSQVHDIGLTGNAAVALANTLAGAGATVSNQGLATLQADTQQVGSNYNQLVGGAGLLTQTGGQVGTNLAASGAGVANAEVQSLSGLFKPINDALATVANSSQQLSANAKALGSNALTTGAAIAGQALSGAQPQSQNSQIIMYVALAVVAVVALPMMMRGKA